MGNCMMGFPNRTDQAVLSGGAWMAALPLTKLQDRVLGRMARSVDLQLASTQFVVDLGKAQKIQGISLRNHNFSLGARYRISASTSAGFGTLAYDSGWADVWPTVYAYGQLEWEDDNWWTRKYTLEESQGYMPELIHLLPAFRLARYWRVEFSDPTNPAGFVQAGRLFIGPAWQAVVNMSYGASLGWETKTGVQEAIGGAEYFDTRIPYRVAKFNLDWMDQDEAFSQAFELMRRAGVDKEILFVHDPDDTLRSLQRRFLCRLRTLSAIEYPYFNVNKTAFEAKELL